MNPGFSRIPTPVNEPVLSYRPGSVEAESLARELAYQSTQPVEIPVIIGGKEIRTGEVEEIRAPHDHGLVLGSFHRAGPKQVAAAAAAAVRASQEWAGLPWEERAAVFLKAAELLAGPRRQVLNAATMLGQSKSVHQAEIDSAAELVDFWRFNPWFMARIFEDQPQAHGSGTWNRTTYRGLEGFVFAVTPFNFTSIAGNLPTAPALMGNGVVWKPASTSVLSGWRIMQVLKEAGLPDGVINFLPGRGAEVGDPLLSHPDLAGLHFTGSNTTFGRMWRTIGENVAAGIYRSYPRIVGETGGKDFVIAAPDADPEALAVALFRGAFEYQGQKCSAASRAYVPGSLWPRVRARLEEFAGQARVGDVADFQTFMGAVIDQASFRNISAMLEHVEQSSDARVVIGGARDDSVGWFVGPTVVEVDNPLHRVMTEEIFGPVLAVFVYEDDHLDQTLALVDGTSPYGLTGGIFARDRRTIAKMTEALEQAAGNFYINDKPTGAVVGQQPFGGARSSGTNDKAGSLNNLLRWTSVRAIKENFVPPWDWTYPHMG